jgi:hypothetical protein
MTTPYVLQDKLFGLQQTQLTSDDHYTPKWVFDRLNLLFDIDVAAPPNGSPFVPCKNYLTQFEDGLTVDWRGLVFMNPPFSNISQWVNKFIDHNNGICLLPVVKSQWYFDLWDSNAKIVRGDPDKSGLKFIYMEKQKRIFPSIIFAALGDIANEALEKAKFGKVR